MKICISLFAPLVLLLYNYKIITVINLIAEILNLLSLRKQTTKLHNVAFFKLIIIIFLRLYFLIFKIKFKTIFMEAMKTIFQNKRII